MHTVVLYVTDWEATRAMAMAVAEELGARAIPFEHRPELALYDLVVLACPVHGLLDPRLALAVALELRGKTVALMTDAGVLGEPAFFGLVGALSLAGARVFSPQLHASMGWLADMRALAIRQAHDWGKLLAAAYPPPTFPRGPAGKRVLQ